MLDQTKTMNEAENSEFNFKRIKCEYPHIRRNQKNHAAKKK